MIARCLALLSLLGLVLSLGCIGLPSIILPPTGRVTPEPTEAPEAAPAASAAAPAH